MAPWLLLTEKQKYPENKTNKMTKQTIRIAIMSYLSTSIPFCSRKSEIESAVRCRISFQFDFVIPFPTSFCWEITLSRYARFGWNGPNSILNQFGRFGFSEFSKRIGDIQRCIHWFPKWVFVLFRVIGIVIFFGISIGIRIEKAIDMDQSLINIRTLFIWVQFQSISQNAMTEISEWNSFNLFLSCSGNIFREHILGKYVITKWSTNSWNPCSRNMSGTQFMERTLHSHYVQKMATALGKGT